MRPITYLIILALLVVTVSFGFPLAKTYTDLFTASMFSINYRVSAYNSPIYYPDSHTRLLDAPNSDFWVAIPSLGVISPVSHPVDIDDLTQQQSLLSRDNIIHVSGSANPNQLGTIVLLAHSHQNINWPKYNSEYYFSSRLKPGKEIVIGYMGARYVYDITSVSKVESHPDLAIDYSSKNLLLLTSQPFISGAKLEVRAQLK